ncbi:hypothetical protein MMYC01_208727 [Madurella mycetomatis]|uniref:Uncharacterized protein n=1 Tax=Madurella mycetomatis TaxID=100816 RepID=A0A175VRF1_9PEZI|nr:hypothetical protein MMYC01_208727 [Madurella mycetomatis]
MRPAQEHPDHKWITTYAPRSKFSMQFAMVGVRCPDNFCMHIYQGYEGHGVMEVIESLVDDARSLMILIRLIGHTFLATLVCSPRTRATPR